MNNRRCFTSQERELGARPSHEGTIAAGGSLCEVAATRVHTGGDAQSHEATPFFKLSAAAHPHRQAGPSKRGCAE